MIRIHDIPALPDNKRRLFAVGGVLLIHLLIVALILSGIPKIIGKRADLREVFFVFSPVPRPHEKPPLAPPTPRRPVHVPIFHVPAISPKPIPAPNPKLKGLGLSLLPCAPENLVNLSPEERDQCFSAQAGASPSRSDVIPGTVRERAVDAGTWSASIARRNSPPRLRCSYIRAIPQDVTTGRTTKVIMVDPLCALGLTKGSQQ